MKKILFILFAITTIAFGQARNTLPDSITVHRTDINAHADSIDGLRTSINSQDDSLGIHLDTLQAIRLDVNTNVDSITAIRTDVNSNIDSLAIHLDTLQAIRVDINTNSDSITAIRIDVNTNVDSLEAIRTDVNAITVGSGYLSLTGDNTVSGNNDFTGTSDFTTGEILIGEKPATPVANQLTMDITSGSSGLWWGTSSRMPDVDGVEEIVDNSYSYNLPEVISTGTDTINFTTDRNFIKSIMSVAADNNLDLYFANSGYGSVTIWVIGGWNSSGTINWDTSIASETLMWVGGTEPPLDTSTSSQLFIINFTKGTSTIIVGQWNYAE